MLARRQSDVLANKLSMDGSTRGIPDRPLPFGSEGVRSPTYVAPTRPGEGASVRAGGGSGGEAATASSVNGVSGAAGGSGSGTAIEEPSFRGPGALFDRDDRAIPVRAAAPMAPSEEERDVLMT